MRSGAAAERYAQALLNVAKSQDCADALLVQIGQVARDGNLESLARLLNNPRVASAEKEAVVRRLFDGTGETGGALLCCFITLLRRKGRVAYLADVLHLYPRLLDRERGVQKGRLTVAYPLEPDVRDRIQARLEAGMARAIVLNCDQDPDLLGGFVFSTGTIMIDASIRTELARLSEKLKSHPVG